MGYMTSTYSMLISALVATQSTALSTSSSLGSLVGKTSSPPIKKSGEYKKLYEMALSELNDLNKEIKSIHQSRRGLEEVPSPSKTPIRWLPTCGAALGARYKADPLYNNGGNDFKCSEFPNLPETCPSHSQYKP